MCESVDELRQREGEIWGTTENPSPVSIEITALRQCKSSESAYFKWNPKANRGRGDYRLQWCHPFNNSSLPYVLFPFQGKKPKRKNEDPEVMPSRMISSIQFTLLVRILNPESISFSIPLLNKRRKAKDLALLCEAHNNIKIDAEAAIWAWINFGGIGARTRRGCGALYCKECDDPDIMPPFQEGFKDWMNERIMKYELKYPITNEWPTIGEIHLARGPNSISCWDTCIRVLKDLRQGDLGRDAGRSWNRPGRSRWPEAESVRELVLKTNNLKSRPNWHDKDPRIPIIAFPRAEFGLPIIIEIRGESLTPGGTSIKPTLQRDEKIDRMASPLILRPIKFRNSKFASMIIRLNKTPLDSAYLKPGRSDLARPQPIKNSQITDSILAIYEDSPMNRGLKTGSAVDAFLAYAKEEGFSPVFP